MGTGAVGRVGTILGGRAHAPEQFDHCARIDPKPLKKIARCGPVPSGEDGRAALEMIMAVHESQRLGTRVSLPLANRENPYKAWRGEDGKSLT